MAYEPAKNVKIQQDIYKSKIIEAYKTLGLSLYNSNVNDAKYRWNDALDVLKSIENPSVQIKNIIRDIDSLKFFSNMQDAKFSIEKIISNLKNI